MLQNKMEIDKHALRCKKLLDEKIKLASSISQFKKHLKEAIIKTYIGNQTK